MSRSASAAPLSALLCSQTVEQLVAERVAVFSFLFVFFVTCILFLREPFYAFSGVCESPFSRPLVSGGSLALGRFGTEAASQIYCTKNNVWSGLNESGLAVLIRS